MYLHGLICSVVGHVTAQSMAGRLQPTTVRPAIEQVKTIHFNKMGNRTHAVNFSS